jgi:hypothetical protein
MLAGVKSVANLAIDEENIYLHARRSLTMMCDESHSREGAR